MKKLAVFKLLRTAIPGGGEGAFAAGSFTPDPWDLSMYLLIFLRVVGGSCLLAFLAAVMPQWWIVETSTSLGFDPFPHSPLTFYLARNLSLLYGALGGLMIIVSLDLDRYRPLIRYAALGTMLFGGLQLIVNSMSGMPAWWTWGESLRTLLGGVLLYWLQSRP